MKIFCKVSITLYMFIFFGCNNSDKFNLGDGYFFLDEFEAMDVGYPGGAVIYKSNKEYYFDEVIIEKTVLDAKSNNRFIIAVQQIPEPPGQKVKLKLNYYVIEKNSILTLRPLSRDGFEKRRKELGVPKSLKFDNY